MNKGCPQVGELPLMPWGLVIDELIANFNSFGYFTQGYADDLDNI